MSLPEPYFFDGKDAREWRDLKEKCKSEGFESESESVDN